MKQASLALLAAIVSAGCAAEPSGMVGGRSEDALAAPELTSIDFDITAYTTPVLVGGSNNPNGGPVDVAENATQILMEARWSCSAGPCALRLFLFDPNRDATDYGTGDGAGAFAINAPMEGTWNAQVQSDTGAAKATGEIRVTVFYGEAPDNYSAFDA